MNATTPPSFASIQLSAPQVYRNMALFPIVTPPTGAATWLTLGQAMEEQALSVTEVNHGGHVPEMAILNNADLPVLLIDGEELIGAKQNRVLNTTILLKERSTTVVPVSCTEHGRWSYLSAKFADSKVVMAHKIRASKLRSVSESLERSAGYQSDQLKVWKEIAFLHSSAGTSSPTGAMHDAYVARERELRQSLTAFSLVPGQTGLLVVIDDQVAGFDFIPYPDTYARQHEKLVKSYVIGSIAEPNPRPAHPDSAAVKAAEFLRTAAECPVSRFPSVGYGTDCRYRSPGIAGAALVHEDRIVHAAFFTLPNEATPADPTHPTHTATLSSLRWRERRPVE